MIKIVGDGKIPEAQALYDVRDALDGHFDRDVYLLAQLSPLFGLHLEGEVIYNVEPLYPGCRSFSIGYLDVLRRNTVLDYSAQNVEFLKKLDIEAFHLPYGYHASLERAKPAKKDIDILCVGSINPRRQAIFGKFDSSVNFQWVQGYYGSNLDRLIARAKVLVNVHYCDDHQLEVVRLNYLMANHCTVVSERGNEAEVNSAYESGVIFSDSESIFNTCLFAMENPFDGYECIKGMPQDCEAAKEWLEQCYV